MDVFEDADPSTIFNLFLWMDKNSSFETCVILQHGFLMDSQPGCFVNWLGTQLSSRSNIKGSRSGMCQSGFLQAELRSTVASALADIVRARGLISAAGLKKIAAESAGEKKNRDPRSDQTH